MDYNDNKDEDDDELEEEESDQMSEKEDTDTESDSSESDTEGISDSKIYISKIFHIILFLFCLIKILNLIMKQFFLT